MNKSSLIAVASLCTSTSAIAQTERELDSHLHGAASLNVVIVDSEVSLELNTPWNNLVGFEHAPQTDDQHALVDSALALLNNPNELFSFSNGDCSPTEMMLENSMAEEHGHDDEHHDDEHADGHKDDHDDEHADGHKDDHDDEHADGHKDDHDDEHADGHKDEHDDEHAHEGEASTHSAVLASYSYQCAQIDQLDQIALTFFDQWSGMVELDVQLVGDKGQTLVELDRENTVLDLTQVK